MSAVFPPRTATRPLAIQKNGTWYSAPARLASQGPRSQVCSRLGVWLLKPHPAYGWDLTKNICETYRTDGRIDLAYTYTPYGEVSPAHTYDQPLRWSSEYHDVESPRRLGGGLDKHEVFAPKGRAPKGVGASQLGLVYYNYRHYNPAMGRWMGRDMLLEVGYIFIDNYPTLQIDFLGLLSFPWEQKQPEASTSPNVIIVPSSDDTEICATCRSKLEVLKNYIQSTYNFQNGNKCTIKLDCQDPKTWSDPDILASYTKDPQTSNNKGEVSGLIALPCGKCNEKLTTDKRYGLYSNHGFSANAKHEIQHAIDNCQGYKPGAITETRAYVLHNVPRGKVSRDIYIKYIREKVQKSTRLSHLPYSEEEFQATIESLHIQ